jgi:hypothetical protein
MVVNENCSLLKYAEIGTLIGFIATGQGILEGWIAAYAPITAPVGYIAGKVFNPSLLPLPPTERERIRALVEAADLIKHPIYLICHHIYKNYYIYLLYLYIIIILISISLFTN